MVSAPASREAAYDDRERLRLWIRILRTARIIEARLRERLAAEFATTLPRFDVMAALFRAPDGMKMSELSRFLLVSNGNVTIVVERLVGESLVERLRHEGDRRVSIVRLTGKGRDTFRKMADAHKGWVDEMLSGLDSAEARHLNHALKSFQSTWEHRH